MPLVSVVIPFYNGEKYIHEALDSVFKQSFRDYEVICVDDGSQSSAIDLLKGFFGQIELISQPNRGQGSARNLGAFHGNGKYIAFLDQDDVWYEHKLERQVEVFEKYSDVVLVHCNSDRIDDEGRILQQGATLSELSSALKSPLGLVIGSGLVLPSSMMVRRDVFMLLGGFDPVLRGFEDFDFIARLKSKGEFVFLDEPGMAWRNHEFGFHQTGGMAIIQSRKHFLLKMKSLSFGDAKKQKLIRKMLADCYSDWGMHDLKSNRNQEARKNFVCSLSQNPFKFRTYSRLVRSFLY